MLYIRPDSRVIVSMIILTAYLLSTCNTSCTEGDIRLRDGATNHEGRVEICHNKEWCTICSQSRWFTDHATVACRQLGFSSTGATALNVIDVVDGSGRMISNRFICTGTETRLLDCSRRRLTYAPSYCHHGVDVGIRCLPHSSTRQICTEGDVRLINGANDLEGRVVFCHSNEWGSVCDTGWEKADAVVVCRELGLPTIGTVGLTGRSFPVNRDRLVWLDEVRCSGSESRLADCPANPIGITYDCESYHDAGVRCAGLSGAQIFGIAFSSLIIFCCGACCLCLLTGIICHKKSKSLNSQRSLQPRASQTNSHPYSAQELINASPTYQLSRPQETDNITIKPFAPPLEAVTHAGEAPPAYHTVMHYKTVNPDTEDVGLSKDSALPSSITTQSDAPPAYKEASDWKQ